MRISKIIAISISVVLSLATPGMLQAQETTSERRISAFRLVGAAYRGRFKKLGIPAYARLDQAYRGRQLTASDLIQAAIEANQLPPNTLQDKSYIKAVDNGLYGLVTR
ncbi:MAG: hypothetical protein AAF298_11520 [Cyanobacteria bacterium P01_A01_bin.40]